MSFIRSMRASSVALGIALTLCFSIQASAADNTQSANTAAATQSASQPSSAKGSTEKVDINTASADQLKTLKGVGDTKAQSIVNYRTEHGAFKSVDELASIRGISQKTLETLLKSNPGRIVAG